MFSSSRRSTRRQSSKRSDKQRQQIAQDRVKPGLKLDTNFSRHVARIPQQILPSTEENTHRAVLQAKAAKPAPLNLGISAFGLKVQDANLHPRAKADQETAAPTIIITPAREDFDISPLAVFRATPRRIASSVYSRYTDYGPKSAEVETVPPVPALPTKLEITRRRGLGPFRNFVSRKDDLRSTPAESVCTVFEEDPSPLASARSLENGASRHSKGWWTYVTSPFSATSNAFTWRSPIVNDPERTPMLQESRRQLVGSAQVEDEPRSAPIDASEPIEGLKRSMTAPTVMSSAPEEVDIYRIPSQGEAAAYYDLNRHFPSLIISPSEQSVRATTGSSTAPAHMDTQATYQYESRDNIAIPFEVTANPFLNATTYDALDGNEQSRAMFSTPDATELKTPVAMPSMPGEHETPFSPLSPSPILGHAQVAQIISAKPGREQSADLPSDTIARGLGFTTMASRPNGDEKSSISTVQHTVPVTHSRSSSVGLGIFGDEYDEPRSTIEASEKQTAPNGPPWYRRFLWLILATITLLITLMIVLLVMHIPQNHADVPVQAQWVNLTGWPALPTGVMTVAQPKQVRDVSGCVAQSMWSCTTGNGAVPDFRFEIRIRNDSSFNSSALQSLSKRSETAFARWNVRRDAWSDSIFTAVPGAPSTVEQIFLGNTTDNNTSPYNGEATPFYISLLNSISLNATSQHQKRQSVFPYPTSDNTTAGNASNASQSIPKPTTQDDGRPFPSLLYLLAQAQPLRLYKRGQADEHYGFYTYYDKTVYISNGTNDSILADAPLANATAICTWSQSRMLVQIWTRNFVTNLATSNASTSIDAVNSTANDLTFPGSLPYASTITIDRHGGDPDHKGVYCYGLDADQRVVETVKGWIAENRGYGGTLVNPANVPHSSVTKRDVSSSDGVDGGTGGCACAWNNW